MIKRISLPVIVFCLIFIRNFVQAQKPSNNDVRQFILNVERQLSQQRTYKNEAILRELRTEINQYLKSSWERQLKEKLYFLSNQVTKILNSFIRKKKSLFKRLNQEEEDSQIVLLKQNEDFDQYQDQTQFQTLKQKSLTKKQTPIKLPAQIIKKIKKQQPLPKDQQIILPPKIQIAFQNVSHILQDIDKTIKTHQIILKIVQGQQKEEAIELLETAAHHLLQYLKIIKSLKVKILTQDARNRLNLQEKQLIQLMLLSQKIKQKIMKSQVQPLPKQIIDENPQPYIIHRFAKDQVITEKIQKLQQSFTELQRRTQQAYTQERLKKMPLIISLTSAVDYAEEKITKIKQLLKQSLKPDHRQRLQQLDKIFQQILQELFVKLVQASQQNERNALKWSHLARQQSKQSLEDKRKKMMQAEFDKFPQEDNYGQFTDRGFLHNYQQVYQTSLYQYSMTQNQHQLLIQIQQQLAYLCQKQQDLNQQIKKIHQQTKYKQTLIIQKMGVQSLITRILTTHTKLLKKIEDKKQKQKQNQIFMKEQQPKVLSITSQLVQNVHQEYLYLYQRYKVSMNYYKKSQNMDKLKTQLMILLHQSQNKHNRQYKSLQEVKDQVQRRINLRTIPLNIQQQLRQILILINNLQKDICDNLQKMARYEAQHSLRQMKKNEKKKKSLAIGGFNQSFDEERIQKKKVHKEIQTLLTKRMQQILKYLQERQIPTTQKMQYLIYQYESMKNKYQETKEQTLKQLILQQIKFVYQQIRKFVPSFYQEMKANEIMLKNFKDRKQKNDFQILSNQIAKNQKTKQKLNNLLEQYK